MPAAADPSNDQTGRLRAELLLLAITVVWGGTYLAVKGLLTVWQPFSLVAIRFGLAGLLLLPLFLRVSWHTFVFGSMLGALAFGAFSLQTTGLVYTSAARSAFITGLFVVFTPLLDIAIRRRAPRTGSTLALPLIFVGLWLLTSPGEGSFNKGDLLTLGAAFLFALHILGLDECSKRADFLALTLIQFLSTAVFAALPAIVWENPSMGTLLSIVAVPANLWWLAFLVLPATVLLFAIQMRFQKDTTPVRAAVIFSLEPVFAALFAFWWIGERMQGLEIVGAALMLAGVLLAETYEFVIYTLARQRS